MEVYPRPPNPEATDPQVVFRQMVSRPIVFKQATGHLEAGVRSDKRTAITLIRLGVEE
jgi:hypothetical protein